MPADIVKLGKGLGIVAPWPALYIEAERAVVLADLHLGLEDEQEAKGIHIPVTVFPRILESVLAPARAVGASKVILLGDVKHEFGPPTEAEWFAVRKLVKAVKEAGHAIEVVRGNHDNYIAGVLRHLDIPLHQPHLALDGVLLKHGHEELNEAEWTATHLIMGHEHPVVALKDDVGIRHRFKAFLSGKAGNRRLTILPSVSPLAYGTDINEVPASQLLSPLLQRSSLDDLWAYPIEIGLTLKRFPKLRYL
jgi:hypothetical protein